MYRAIVVFTTVFIGICVIKLLSTKRDEINIQFIGFPEWQDVCSCLGVTRDFFRMPFKSINMNNVYAIYFQISCFDMIIFILKYVPTGIYMYKFLKNTYKSSLESIRQKKNELEEIQLQIEIVNTKLCMRDAEFTERLEQVQLEEKRLREVRAKVRAAIAAWHAAEESNERQHDYQFALDLLKDMKYDLILGPQNIATKMENGKLESGEYAQTNPDNEGSVYSSLSEGDIKKGCVFKIVKVTNVHMTAYLKHLIKKKRMRRASRQKKRESGKTLLENWHRSLNLALHYNMSECCCGGNMGMASNEAMGDYAKQNYIDLDDSCGIMSDVDHDDSFNTSNCSEHDIQDPSMGREYDSPMQDYFKNLNNFCQHGDNQSKVKQLEEIAEETSSEIAIK